MDRRIQEGGEYPPKLITLPATPRLLSFDRASFFILQKAPRKIPWRFYNIFYQLSFAHVYLFPGNQERACDKNR